VSTRPATLYVIPGSHACRTATLMLEHKRVAYRTVVLPAGLHPMLIRLRGFPGHRDPIRTIDGATPRMLGATDRLGTVPALRLDGQRIQTNIAIARHLDRTRPQPPLYPVDAALRGEVQEAERWGDETLQMAARRTVLAVDDLDALHDRGGEGRLGALLSRNDTLRVLASGSASRLFRASAGAERDLVEKVPALLDRVDGWIATGVLGGEQLNAADMMIAPSLALLAYRRDLRPLIEARPAGALLERVLPQTRAPAGETPAASSSGA
jgi:glutathione S-transferase